MVDQCLGRASAVLRQRFVSASSALRQRFVSASSALRQRFVSASSALRQRFVNGGAFVKIEHRVWGQPGQVAPAEPLRGGGGVVATEPWPFQSRCVAERAWLLTNRGRRPSCIDANG